MYAGTAILDLFVVCGYIDQTVESVGVASVMTVAALKSRSFFKEKLLGYHERS